MFFEAKHLEMTNFLSFHQIILDFIDVAIGKYIDAEKLDKNKSLW